jgi:outer membrane immunogenic protein
MLKYVAAALLAGTTLVSTPALAQEQAPFTGLRVEGIVGYDTLRSGEEDDGTNTGSNNGDESIDGIGYGVGVGFDVDVGGFVLGVEGEYAESEAEQEFDETIDGTAFLGNIEVGRDIYVGGRVGFVAGPSTLVYAKGGYTNTTIESAFSSAGNSTVNFDTSVDGWRLGAGIEQRLGNNLYLKGEYRYSNYNGLRFDDEVFGDEDFDIDLDRHQVMAGIGLRF